MPKQLRHLRQKTAGSKPDFGQDAAQSLLSHARDRIEQLWTIQFWRWLINHKDLGIAVQMSWREYVRKMAHHKAHKGAPGLVQPA